MILRMFSGSSNRSIDGFRKEGGGAHVGLGPVVNLVFLDAKVTPQQVRDAPAKACKWLGQSDQLVLKAWCLATFGHVYKDVIMEVFEKTMSR